MRLFLNWGGVELFDKSRGGDETRHKYLTHSEWHTDSKFVGLLKVGYQASILEIKSYKKAVYENDEQKAELAAKKRENHEHSAAAFRKRAKKCGYLP